jgi:predicted  nucleic acid-binding Zn-ribbon protein
MAWTQALMQYQETDLELQSNQKRLVELALLLKDASALQDAQKHLDQAHANAKKARIDQETIEFEFGKVETKLRSDTERLYSGRITNSRELQDLQAETQSLKRHLSSLEDQLFESMLIREEADNLATQANAEFEHIKAQTAESQQHLTQEQDTLLARNAELTVLMEKLSKQIPPSILDTYEYLKKRTGNLPVARLNGDICSVCGIEVIKPVQQKARRNEEAICGGCNRLLVVID